MLPFVQMDETYLQVLKSEKAPSCGSLHGGARRRSSRKANHPLQLRALAQRRGAEESADRTTGALYRKTPHRWPRAVRQRRRSVAADSPGLPATLPHVLSHGGQGDGAPSGKNLARMAIEEYIGKVYAVERHIKELREERERAGGTLAPEVVLKIRQDRSAPILAAFKDWVDKLLPGVPPTSALGKALSYTTKQWPKLVRHLEHPDVPVDNNYLENQIRPFAQGRRLWLFAQNPYGAKASANLYSLVSCARVNGLEPHSYFLHLLEELPKASTADALEALLPWNVNPFY